MSDRITVTIPELRAGAWRRREVKAAVRGCRVLGAEVHYSELWGLLESVITIRAIGTEQEVKPLMRLIDTIPREAR